MSKDEWKIVGDDFTTPEILRKLWNIIEFSLLTHFLAFFLYKFEIIFCLIHG